jgi:hypothetical protein
MANTNVLHTVTRSDLNNALADLSRKSDTRDMSAVHFASLLILGAMNGQEDFSVDGEIWEQLGTKTRDKHPIGSNACAAFLNGDRKALMLMLNVAPERLSTFTDGARVAKSMNAAIAAGMAKLEDDGAFSVQWRALVSEKQRNAASEEEQKVCEAFVKLGDKKAKKRTWNVTGKTGDIEVRAKNNLASFKRAWGLQRAAQQTEKPKPSLQIAASAMADYIEASTEKNQTITVKLDDEENPVASMIVSLASNDALYALVVAARAKHEAEAKAKADKIAAKRKAA